MSADPGRWVKTLHNKYTKHNRAECKLDSNRWVSTLPGKDVLYLDNAIVDNTIADNVIIENVTNPKTSSGKKYFSAITAFVIGLILVSVTKNGTKNLQKEIGNLEASINVLKLDLHQTILEHEVITSPENISRLAKEYLETDFASYKKSQIKQLNGKMETLAKLEENNNNKIFNKKNKIKTDKIKLQVAKKIAVTKTELKKLQELYSQPEKLPGEIKIQVAKTIETKKNELEKLYSDPSGVFKSKKARNWAGLQIVKAFLGIPIVPGK